MDSVVECFVEKLMGKDLKCLSGFIFLSLIIKEYFVCGIVLIKVF